ncbi:MAG: aromatic ring-hydroxylating oxygenase subunit alpha, partial [Gaiellaceae bacterium]
MTPAELRESLERGATLPADWYADPAILRLERERIFARAWQYAGRLDLVAEAGDFFTCSAGHVPVVVVRGRDGELRGFVNVCRHRGHIVADGAGHRETLQCRYHAWTYDLDGSLRAAPRSEREPGFDATAFSLLPVRVESWGPIVFVTPAPEAGPLADALGDLPALVAESGLDLARLQFRERVDWEVKANWKIGIENYLECYHCPVAHPGFSKVMDVDPDAYLLRSHGVCSTQLAPVKESARTGNGPAYVSNGAVTQAQYHFVWPNTTINVEAGPVNMSVDISRPGGAERTVGLTDYYFADDVDDETAHAIMAFANQVGA